MCVIWALYPMVVRGLRSLNGQSYKMDFISSVGHPKSDSVVPLVLCMVACNGWGTGVVLQVPRDSANFIEKG
jgi:hypothetical protein